MDLDLDLEMKSVVTVLTQGKEIANELKKRLRPTTTPNHKCDSLLDKILSSYENALDLLRFREGSQDRTANKPVSKRRKTARDQERHCTATAQLDDGYHWRKYGQKDILGANHPRAYYRCTHRNTQGCLATKQVQRADDNSSILEVVYRGKHSCIQDRTKRIKSSFLTTTTTINTGENFPCLPKIENVETELFSQPENKVHSPAFLSPATSDSYFSLPNGVMDDGFGFGYCLEGMESEIISNPTPVMELPLDFSIDKMNFDPHLLDCFDGF